MITRVGLRDFKRFASLDIETRAFTLLTGLNGAGKSSVIQSLLLARIAARTTGELVPLNGDYGLALGTAGEILHANAEGDEVRIRVVDQSGVAIEFVFGADDAEASTLRLRARPVDLAGCGLDGSGLRFAYLAAERLGPRNQLALAGCDPDVLELGPHGEHVAEVLFARDRDVVSERLLHPATGTERDRIVTVGHQLELWLDEIVRPLRVDVRRDLTFMAASLRFREHAATAEYVRPTNMGFGVSYVLRIIVAGLLVPPGGLLLVENPEAHLHPAGQSRLTRFLTRVAGGGVQVVVETHSDHVINGLRRGVAEDAALAAEQVLIQWFGDDAPRALDVDESGRLSDWPQGFFDQMDEDLGAIARTRRST